MELISDKQSLLGKDHLITEFKQNNITLRLVLKQYAYSCHSAVSDNSKQLIVHFL